VNTFPRTDTHGAFATRGKWLSRPLPNILAGNEQLEGFQVPKFDKSRAERIIRALAAEKVKHENITRILNYEFDVPDIVFVSSHDSQRGITHFGVLKEQGGHDYFLDLK
jgi:hypothetical protein